MKHEACQTLATAWEGASGGRKGTWRWEEAPVFRCGRGPSDGGVRKEAGDGPLGDPPGPRRQPAQRPRERPGVGVRDAGRARAGDLNSERRACAWHSTRGAGRGR